MQREETNSSMAKATVTNIRVVYPSFASSSETFSQPLTLKGLAKDEEDRENAKQESSPTPEPTTQSDPTDH
jgi:hypothetical protein